MDQKVRGSALQPLWRIARSMIVGPVWSAQDGGGRQHFISKARLKHFRHARSVDGNAFFDICAAFYVFPLVAVAIQRR